MYVFFIYVSEHYAYFDIYFLATNEMGGRVLPPASPPILIPSFRQKLKNRRRV